MVASFGYDCLNSNAGTSVLLVIVTGIVGGQLFRADDLPFYHRDWSVAVGYLSGALAVVAGLMQGR